MINCKKKVLLINPTRLDDSHFVDRVHMGLLLLGSILCDAGHEVKILDYAYLRNISHKLKVPTLESQLRDFCPDVVGISVFSYTYYDAEQMISNVARLSCAPIVVGGPHVTLFPEDFYNNSNVSYIVCGEAESVILDLVNAAKIEENPVVVNCRIPEGKEIPRINLNLVYGHEYLGTYQIQLSRGCPFKCSFCNIAEVAGDRNVRPRDIDNCIQEIVDVRAKHNNIDTIAITDDCPNYDLDRIKYFLKKFTAKLTGLTLTIDNVRADLLDIEFIKLFKSAGGKKICIGVESAHPDVYALVNKGESTERIFETAKLIRELGLGLGLCFVIGLPKDTMEKHLVSVECAKVMKPDFIYWNMCVPWPKTFVYDWFAKNGYIDDVRGFSTLIDPEFNFSKPRAWTDLFSREDRIKAWLLANLETHVFPAFPLRVFARNFIKMTKLAFQYRIYISYFRFLLSFFPRYFKALLADKQKMQKR